MAIAYSLTNERRKMASALDLDVCYSDDFGIYRRVPKDSIMASAPTKRNGRWDMRYSASRDALALYNKNKEAREAAAMRGEEDLDKFLVFY